MQRIFSGNSRSFATLVVVVMLSGFPSVGRAAAEPLPDASAVTRRMIERAQAVAQGRQGGSYTCDKRTLTEHLDAAGKSTKSEERLYEARWVAGFPFSRLVKIQGRDLNSEELKKEDQKEERLRQKVTAVDVKKMAARKEAWLSAQLLDRFAFTVKERVLMNGRPTLVLTFKPRGEKNPAKTFMDKVLNQFVGTVWVDEADAETAKVSANLEETVSAGWFGMLGALHQCDLSLDRQRMADGGWVNVKQVLLIHYRKVTATTRLRATEESSAFKQAEPKN